jgi:hypothetical protein
LERADTARMLTLVGVVYNIILGLRLGLNASMTSLGSPLEPLDPLTSTMFFLMGVAVLAGSLLLPCIAYYRITRAHKRSAGIFLISGGVILTATAPFFSVAMVIGGVLFLAAGGFALVSRPEAEAPIHVAESILPVNRYPSAVAWGHQVED